MAYSDYHVHTRFSPDSQADIEEYIALAKKLGQEHIIFTDHREFGALDPKFNIHIDYDEYIMLMKDLEEKHQFKIKVGVEIGYMKSYLDEIHDFLNRYDFDFVIASIHYGDEGDFYLGNFFDGKTKYKAYMDYFELVLDMVENLRDYDVVGHLDYIPRYGPYEDKHYEYGDYKDIIDEILKVIIKNKKGIEVNTSGLRSPLNVTFPKDEVLLRYKELGGKIITVGSDCHFVDHYMANVKETAKKLEAMGFQVRR